MSDVLSYKGYYAKIEYSVEDRVLHGRIEGIRDLVNFESNSPDEIESAFQEAVDDYLAFCEDVGQTPEKPYSGAFNVRIPREMHRRAVINANLQGISLNQWIVNAVDSALKGTG